MRIAIDARTIQRRPYGGVGRCVASTATRLAEEFDVTLLTDSRDPAADLGLPEVALASRGPSVVWLQTSAPLWLARNRDVIFHCPWYGLPYALPVRGVASIHDLTFEHRPEWFAPGPLQAFRRSARHAGRVAKAIITPSQHSKDDIASTYGVEPGRIFVAPAAVDAVFSPAATHHQALPADYFVAVGGAERRRVDLAVLAWRQARTGAALVVLGQPDLAPEAGLIALPRISDEEWAGVLAGAQALIYPTEDEGFGLPPLEAAASGTPTVAARTGSVPEVMGDAATWSDSLHPADLARAIHRLDPGAGARAMAHAAKAATWDDAADAIAAAYRHAAAH